MWHAVQVGSIFEFANKNAIFGAVPPSSPLYAPILLTFAVTGIPSAGTPPCLQSVQLHSVCSFTVCAAISKFKSLHAAPVPQLTCSSRQSIRQTGRQSAKTKRMGFNQQTANCNQGMRVRNKAAVHATTIQETGMPASLIGCVHRQHGSTLVAGLHSPETAACLQLSSDVGRVVNPRDIMAKECAQSNLLAVPHAAPRTSLAGKLHEAASTTLLPLLFAHLSCCPDNQESVTRRRPEPSAEGRGRSQDQRQQHRQALTLYFCRTRYTGGATPAARPAAAGRTTACKVTTLPSPKCDAKTSARRRSHLSVHHQTAWCPYVTPSSNACAHTPSSMSPLSRNFPPKMSFRSAEDPGCSARNGPSARPHTAHCLRAAAGHASRTHASSRAGHHPARILGARAFRPPPKQLLLDALHRECPGHRERANIALREPAAQVHAHLSRRSGGAGAQPGPVGLRRPPGLCRWSWCKALPALWALLAAARLTNPGRFRPAPRRCGAVPAALARCNTE